MRVVNLRRARARVCLRRRLLVLLAALGLCCVLWVSALAGRACGVLNEYAPGLLQSLAAGCALGLCAARAADWLWRRECRSPKEARYDS